MQHSALYVGTVGHVRLGAPQHRFSYTVWHALIDLDELPGLASRVRGFSHNRFNLVGFDDRDHMGPSAEPVRLKLERWLLSRGIDEDLANVSLLTQLRVLGHVFNPVSFYFCRDHEHALRHVVVEVNNTFGETYCYLLAADGETVRHEEAKAFHVSPFQPLEGRYSFRIKAPGSTMEAHIDLLRGGERVLATSLTAARRPLTGASLLKTVARHPHSGLRTLGMIHYQALRLWLKRAPFFAKPEPPVGAWRARNG
jgi:uncharacterized protein